MNLCSIAPVRSMIIAVLATVLTCIEASAATFTIEGEKPSNLRMSGTIELRDSAKLLAAYKGAQRKPLKLELNSLGGSIQEAILLAKTVRQLSLATEVAANSTCASACFIVFLSGWSRTASPAEWITASDLPDRLRASGINPSGFVGIHRPFFETTSSANKQSELMIAVRAYLRNELVPESMQDMMMSRPSNDVHWLTASDLYSLGEFSPYQEEFLIRRCQYDRNLSNKIVDAISVSDRTRETILRASEEALRDCLTAEHLAAAEQSWKRFGRAGR